MDRSEEALAEYSKACEFNPLDSTAWLRRAKLQLRRGDESGARSSLESILVLNEKMYPRMWTDNEELRRSVLDEARRLLPSRGERGR